MNAPKRIWTYVLAGSCSSLRRLLREWGGRTQTLRRQIHNKFPLNAMADTILIR